MKKFALIFVAAIGLWLVSANEGAAQNFRSGFSVRPTGLFNFQLGFGVNTYGNPYRGGHWNWNSGRYYRHGNHLHWAPGQMHWNSSPFYSRGPFGPYNNRWRR